MSTYLNRDFLAELKSIINRVNGVKPSAEIVKPKRAVPRYKLLAINGDVRREVGWNLLYDEAILLARVLVRRIRRLSEPNDSGGPLFEITQHEVLKCQSDI